MNLFRQDNNEFVEECFWGILPIFLSWSKYDSKANAENLSKGPKTLTSSHICEQGILNNINFYNV